MKLALATALLWAVTVTATGYCGPPKKLCKDVNGKKIEDAYKACKDKACKDCCEAVKWKCVDPPHHKECEKKLDYCYKQYY